MVKNAEDIVQYYEKVTEKSAKAATTPGFFGVTLDKNIGETVMLDEYRSLVGKILFYVFKIGPDCGNASRDLAGICRIQEKNTGNQWAGSWDI